MWSAILSEHVACDYNQGSPVPDWLSAGSHHQATELFCSHGSFGGGSPRTGRMDTDKYWADRKWLLFGLCFYSIMDYFLDSSWLAWALWDASSWSHLTAQPKQQLSRPLVLNWWDVHSRTKTTPNATIENVTYAKLGYHNEKAFIHFQSEKKTLSFVAEIKSWV